MELRHLRDTDKREVDFVVLKDGKPVFAVECKSGEKAIGFDPVGNGLVQSFARPGENVTGISILSYELMPKRLALLKEAVPALTRVAVLYRKGNINAARVISALAEPAKSLRASNKMKVNSVQSSSCSCFGEGTWRANWSMMNCGT